MTFEDNVVSGCNQPLEWKNNPTVTTWDYDNYGCDNAGGISCPGGFTSTSQLLCVAVSSCTYYNLSQMQGTLGIDAHGAWNPNAGATNINTTTGTPSNTAPGGVTGPNLTSACTGLESAEIPASLTS